MNRVVVLVSLIIASILTLSSSNVTTNNKHSHFVLVHGAGHGAWCWYKVATLLQSTGHKVTAIDLTASGINPIQVTQVNGSLLDYAKPLTDFMASLPSAAAAEKVVLVGHSLGGLSISLAMERFPHKISAAVFVTALMPSPNLTYSQIFEENLRRIGSLMDSTFIYGEGPNSPPTALFLGPNLLASKFYQLSPPEDLVLGLSLVRPYDTFSNKELLNKQLKLTKEKYGSVRRVFIVCDQDHTIEESLQRWKIERNPPHQVMIINGTDHMPLMDFMASLPSSEAAEEVVLVGHSLGGLSISLAMESFPHKISAANTRRFGSPMDSTFIYGQGPNNPPTAVLFGPNLLASKFYQLSPPEDLVLALTLLRPYDQFSNEELLSEQLKLTKEKYGSVRRVFIVCDQDYVIEESMQRWMIEKNPPHEVMVINQTDHMVMFSNPLMLFSHLEQIACTPNILT
ncbi:hypothetical protein F8388_017092 [Cannabis sativa]|uniref:(S)-hydroxynitrile lyase n=1 Tax=Cannabis sativa TaxID=3483 RepID=A0A7J6GD33_CANSA|nr:hypothetical protein F8388_017092 [Cannabis sativa]